MIDDKDRVKEIWRLAYPKIETDAKRHIYTKSFSDFYYTKMKESEKTVRKGDLLFCGAALVLFVSYDGSACWTHPQNGKSSGATDATIVANL